jgi:hypothetical protein
MLDFTAEDVEGAEAKGFFVFTASLRGESIGLNGG